MPGHLAHILIIDDDPDVAYAAQLLLRRADRRVETLAEPRRLAAILQRCVPDVVLLDFNFTPGRTDGAEGLQVLDQLRALPDPPLVIAVTAYAAVALAVEAMKRGACDFLTKPWDNARMLAAVDGAVARRAAQQSQLAAPPADPLMGTSRAMRELRAMVASVGPTEANVMVLGENGVGKELVARAIHMASRRAASHFLAVDMGSLPEATLESELFGHRKGAFTDARSERAGRFQAAAGGTLFLDEIGNLPLAAQSKLLTALERREVTPLGADRPEAIDVRIVSATNLDEGKLYDASVFRPDLLFRLNTIVLRVPPLRERRDDIAALLAHYLAHYQQQYEKGAGTIAPAAFDALSAHPWPGNVRALRHACERAVILGQPGHYRLADFGLPGGEQTATLAPVANPNRTPAAGAALQLDVLEREAIVAALARANGNVTRASKMLGVSRAALYRKLEKSMPFDAWPRACIGAGALVLAAAAATAGARYQVDGTALSFAFIGCVWACIVALALIRRGTRVLASGAASRIEVAVGASQEHPQLAARVLALELQLEHAPVALFRIDLAGATEPLTEPLNASARRLLAPGRAADAQAVKRALAALVAGERAVIDFATEQGTERALATAGAMIVEGKPQRLAALLPMENELEAEAIEAWQKLVHVLTHEIMNSLTPVASLSRTLRTLLDGVRTSMPGAIVQDFDTSLNAISRRADSLTQFVSGYRVLASVPDAQAQPVVVAHMFARLAALVAPSWEARGGSAVFAVEPDALELMADAGQLEQALMNLVINAAEASAGREAPQLSVTARPARGGRLRIEVCDNGPGVPDGLVADIFTPFFSTKSRGSGIGLALVRQLIHRNGGAVRYAKSIGSGARFVITF